MRERLTLAFVAITVLVLVGAGAVRSYALEGRERERESQFVTGEATTIAEVISERRRAGEPVDAATLTRFAVAGLRLSYAEPRRPAIVVTGNGFDDSDVADAVSATVVVDGGTITVSRAQDDEGRLWGSDWRAILGLFTLLALVAGLLGYFVARTLSEPFRQLAVAAAALGRGRFDLDLPDTRVPEARAIAQALDSSATQLKERLERERAFGLHTSHVLRTPLTSLRLRLEVLLGDPELSEEAREAALACLKAVGQLTEVAGELVEISGRGVLVATAALPLKDLATQVAQRWADVLDDDGRELTAAVEGDIELLFTPGPVEQVLDLLLEDVVHRSSASVRLVFEGAAGSLRVDITASDRQGRRLDPEPVTRERVRLALDAFGGRVEVLPAVQVTRLHLPRR